VHFKTPLSFSVTSPFLKCTLKANAKISTKKGIEIPFGGIIVTEEGLQVLTGIK